MTDQTTCNCPRIGSQTMHNVGCILSGMPIGRVAAAWERQTAQRGDADILPANTLGRVVDQPPPVPNERVAIVDLVIADMVERKRVGTERYGTPLQAHNGRDMLVDAYQEALDQCIYLRGEIEDRADPVPRFSAWDLAQISEVHIPPDSLETMADRVRKFFRQP